MKKRNLQRAKKIAKVTIRFSEKKLTSNAGLVPIYNFINKIGLPELLDRKLTVKRGDNAVHSTGFAVLIVLFGVAAGAKHISHMVMLKGDCVISEANTPLRSVGVSLKGKGVGKPFRFSDSNKLFR